MLDELEPFQRRCKRTYTIDDLTMIVAVRAHADNPWVKERLAWNAGYYEPAPRVIVVDFGSVGEHRSDLERISRESGFEHVYVDDTAMFCASKARNIGAAHAETDLLFFNDIDCFGARDLCGRLVSYANAIDLGACFDQVIDLPVYHLSEETTRELLAAESTTAMSDGVQRAFVDSVYSSKGTVSDFVDPLSNFFVCHRKFYDLVGGFNETFRGHGSEDFEFILRHTLHSGQFPHPKAPNEDHYGPLVSSFFGAKDYRGFRRLGELTAFHAELAGLRIAHLHHPRPMTPAGWYQSNDWKRDRFVEQTEPYLGNHRELLRYDWMPRRKRALVLLAHDWQYAFFIPLRLAGYALDPVFSDRPEEIEVARKRLEAREVDAVAIFNPYMKSHRMFRPLFDLARRSGMETIVVERGALPESWYYGPDVSYNDPDWCVGSVENREFASDELELARRYIDRLRSGESTLEAMGDMAGTVARYEAVRASCGKTCLVPLQLDDDMAVTQYTEGHIPYAEFRDSLASLVRAHPEITFLVKQHPLSNVTLSLEGDNVTLCSPDDNIHGLIESVDAVICYNSGVGLLALLHGRRVVTVGNAFYNLPGLGKRAANAEAAVDLAFGPAPGFNELDLTRFVAWLLFEKYSFFKADSSYRDFGTRKAHDYRNLRFYHLNLAGEHSHLRAAIVRPFSRASYAAARLGTNVRRTGAGMGASWLSPAGNGPVSRKLRKLRRDPKQFFADSKLAPLRWLGGRLSS